MNFIHPKAQPFFEHIVIGLAYAWMGYLFFWTFNKSFLGIFGMTAVCFGALKILIGVVIYGIWLLSLVFGKKPGQSEAKAEGVGDEFDGKSEATERGGEAASTRTIDEEYAEESFVDFVKNNWATLAELFVLVLGFLIVGLTKAGIIF